MEFSNRGEADRIIIYGYSFPKADVQSLTFFKRAATQMKNKPLLVSINPDLTAAQRAADIFSPQAQLVCESVRTYLSDRIKGGMVI